MPRVGAGSHGTASPPPGSGVYRMRMARVNVYLPDDLAEEVRAADLNVSKVAQEALRRELAANRSEAWLEEVRRLPRLDIDHETVLRAVREAKDELWGPE